MSDGEMTFGSRALKRRVYAERPPEDRSNVCPLCLVPWSAHPLQVRRAHKKEWIERDANPEPPAA